MSIVSLKRKIKKISQNNFSTLFEQILVWIISSCFLQADGEFRATCGWLLNK